MLNAIEGETGIIISVVRAGWAGDTSYDIRIDDTTRHVDAYEVGTALLRPGEVVTLPPAPNPNG